MEYNNVLMLHNKEGRDHVPVTVAMIAIVRVLYKCSTLHKTL